MIWALFLVLLGVFLLLVSTRAFMGSAIETSLALRISPLIIGVTVVAIGTSLPELVVSFLAAIGNEPGLAIGNIVGSNIVNIFLVFPFSVLLRDLKMGISKTQKNANLLLLVTLVFFLANLLKLNNRMLGILLLILALVFTLMEYRWGVLGRENEDIAYTRKEEKPLDLKTILLLIVSLVGIFCGGGLIVRAVELISELSGYSTTFWGLSLAAIATSMPELMFTIVAGRKAEQKAVTGNVLGSNIYNILLIGGITLLFSSIPKIPNLTWAFFIFSTLSLYGLVQYFKGRIVPKWIAYLFFLYFLVFLYSLKFT